MPPLVIVDAPQAAPDGKGENNALSAPPPILRIKDLLYGNDANNSYQTVKLYSCSDGHGADQYLKPVVQNVNLVGLKQRVMEILLGSATNGNGLIAKFSTNQGLTAIDAVKPLHAIGLDYPVKAPITTTASGSHSRRMSAVGKPTVWASRIKASSLLVMPCRRVRSGSGLRIWVEAKLSPSTILI